MRVTRIPHSVPHPDPQGRLDKSIRQIYVSQGRGFCTKSHAQPNYPGGILGVTLDRAMLLFSDYLVCMRAKR